jgi:hypothetical protein
VFGHIFAFGAHGSVVEFQHDGSNQVLWEWRSFPDFFCTPAFGAIRYCTLVGATSRDSDYWL